MKKLIALIVGISLMAPNVAYAVSEQACYTKREAEAEQGIRIHSELMVIGLNCAHMSTANGKNLYAEHRKFTASIGKLLATYEKIMMDYLKRTGEPNPEKKLHEIRTNFANKISTDAAKMRPDKFCHAYAPRIEIVTKMDELAFRQWAATPYKEYPVSKPLCP